MTTSRLANALKPHAASIAIAAAAIAIASGFVAVTRHHTKFGLPIEDAYIYLTYAKQFGRAQPFTYFPGGGYSAGSTSILWPMVLAPFWTLGARGDALVWVSFLLCTGLYAVTAVLTGAIVRRMFGPLAAIVAAGFALAIAPLAFTELSGMEVAFASTLLLAAIVQLFGATAVGPPKKALFATLAALSLSRPEAMIIVVIIVGVHGWQRVRRRAWREAALWAATLLPAVAWLSANRALVGHWFPNTGVAKSHFYLPGFDWTYWVETVVRQTGAMMRALFWDSTSPFVWPKLVALMWLAGAVRILRWASREDKRLVGVLVVFAPLGLALAVIASSGSWPFHNYRYISCVFPLVMATAACGIAPWPWKFRRAWSGALIALLAGFAIAAGKPMRADMDLYAQDVVDLNTQVITLGHYIHDHTPDATIMFHDAGAIAYYGDTRVYDMLGLVTNDQARIANNGPGSRFEFLESLPEAKRPTLFAYYPSWMGQSEFYGEVLVETPLAAAFHSRRLIGDYDMQLIVARWDHVHTAERPLVPDAAWELVDRVDVADIASEDAHGWVGSLGRRSFGEPTAHWSVFHREQRGALHLDGGRTIRGGTEAFTITVDPTRPVRLLMRTGGNNSYSLNEPIVAPVDMTITDDRGVVLGHATLPRPNGALVEVPFEFHTDRPSLRIVTHAAGLYRVFHWFVLQSPPIK